MNAALTRRLAALQVRAQLLSAQGKLLSDLGDIKECRRLQKEVAAIRKDSAARGLTPNDPLEEMLAKWRSLVDWSNKVQSRLRDVDALCAEQSRLSDWGSVVSYDWLQRWRDRLSLALSELERGCSESRGTMVAGAWDQGRVDPDLLTVGTVMAAPLKFECAEEDDSEEEKPGPAEILSSSFRAVQPKSPEVAARLRLIRDTRGKADAALAEFPRQRAALAQMCKLLAAGELTQAESRRGACGVRFADLDYKVPFKALGERRSRLYKASAELAEAKGSAAQHTSIPSLEEALRRLEMLANGLESKGRETCGEESRLWVALAKEAASARELTAQHILRARQSERRRLTLLWVGAAILDEIREVVNGDLARFETDAVKASAGP
jgi:hypothetical protein